MSRFVALTALVLCTGCLDMGPPMATIYVHNGDATATELRVTDNAECQLGLTGTLGQNTRTTYEVPEATGGYICLGAGATTGFAVKGGGYYLVKGTTLVDDPHPEGAVSEEGSFLDALEKAGRESTGGK
jgi:hypothetical protein